MAYLDYVGLAYFKSLLDENYLRTDYSGDTTIQGNVTFTEPVDADVKNDYLGNQIDKTYIKDIILDPEGSGALALVLGDGSVSHLLTNTTVSQVRSSANELYPVLLCYDANAEEAQITKTVKYVHDVQINPSTGYISAKGVYVKHPTFNRRNGVTQKVEWAYDFTDGVSGLGNPMSQVYAYVDPAAQGGEHCIELRLYGNPNVSPTVPSINDSTNTFSIGVGVTGGNVQFGYCPSTPLYLDNGSTLRTEATGHGTDIITRDWLNLNGSLTGLVHTTMNETIDGTKTFKKTVTINSGDNNNKAGLYVQGNSDVHGNEHVYGTETVDGKLTANGTAEVKGGSGNTPSLTVTGDEKVTGNSSITGNETVGGNISTTNGNISTTNGTVSGKTGSIGTGGLTVAGNETVSGKITGNNGAEISGGNGLVVNGNETVNGEIYKIVNNTPQEYVSYVTNKQETKTTIVNNLIKDKGGLAVDSNKNIYVSLRNGGGIVNDNGFLRVDFSANEDDSAAQELLAQTKNAILSSLSLQIPLTADKVIFVDKDHSSATTAWRNNQGVIDSTIGTVNKPFKTIQSAVDYISSGFAIGRYSVYINVVNGSTPYSEGVTLPPLNRTTGYITIRSNDINNKFTLTNPSSLYTCIVCKGAGWRISRFNIVSSHSKVDDNFTHYVSSIESSDEGDLRICGCSITSSYIGDAPNNTFVVRTIMAAGGGTITFEHGFDTPTVITVSEGNATKLHVFTAENKGTIVLTSNNGAPVVENSNNLICNGTGSLLLNATISSNILYIGGGAYSMDIIGNFTGKKCNCTNMSLISLTSAGAPGTIAGTVETSSFSKVTPASLLSVE